MKNFLTLLFVALFASFANAQQEASRSEAIASPAKAPVDPVETLAKEREQSLIRSVHALTASASTAADYSAIIDACVSGKQKKISDKSRNYLASLENWSYNRRGQARLELSRDIRSAGNPDQADEILAQAESDFQVAIEGDPHNWRPQLGIGMIQVERKEFLRAIETFTSVCESQPEKPQPWFNRAEIWYAIEQYDKAREDYDRVLQLNSADLQAITGRAHCWLQTGETEKAIRDYEVVARMLPTNNWALINLGDCHQLRGNWSEAYNWYFAAMEAAPNAAGYQKAAWMLATSPDKEFARPQLALSLAEKAIELGGESAVNLESLAAAQAANGQFDAARQTQQLAIAKQSGAAGQMQERLALYKSRQPFRQDQPNPVR